MFIFISLYGNIRALLRKVVESGSCRVQFDLSRLSKDLPSHQVYNPAFEILRQANKMELSLFYEMIGYMGSLLVAFSLTMKSLQKLRIGNMVGALFFITYGLLIGAFTVVLRVFNPAYPEGVMLSILLMNVFAPLIEHLVVQQHIKNRRKRA